MTAETPERDDVVLAERPAPGTPRPYEFPAVTRSRLDNGLTVMVADLPGRPLVSASIVVPVGAADEPASDAGAHGGGRAAGRDPPRRSRLARDERRHRRTVDSTRTGARAAGRGPAPADLPRE